MKYKSQKLQAEFEELAIQNLRLQKLLTAADIFSQLEFKKELTITHIFRTPQEQLELYKLMPPDKRPASSPHMFWEAADLRSSDLSLAEIQRLVTFLNQFKYVDNRPVALYHQIVGNAPHFHVQFKRNSNV